VFSQSVGRALALGNRLRTGILHINDQTVADEPHIPFGGTGASGNGTRIGGPANWEEFTNWQWVTIKDKPNPIHSDGKVGGSGNENSAREEEMKWQLGRLASAAAIGIVATASLALAADPPKSIKIGYVVSLSGVNAQGAAVTTLPAYKLWVDDVNKKGGLMIKEFNKRIPIEVVEYDDTSNAEAAVRLTERLMTQDKVDFVLPPWSTGFNLAVAPVYARNGYPHSR
jgi:ABC-type branched-chain amino acid transport systems, periplasmic component